MFRLPSRLSLREMLSRGSPMGGRAVLCIGASRMQTACVCCFISKETRETGGSARRDFARYVYENRSRPWFPCIHAPECIHTQVARARARVALNINSCSNGRGTAEEEEGEKCQKNNSRLPSRNEYGKAKGDGSRGIAFRAPATWLYIKYLPRDRGGGVHRGNTLTKIDDV